MYYAYLDKTTPVIAKLLILFTVGYAMSPIDLIPDFIPILGYLDDLIILPLLITLSIKLIPAQIMIKSREKAEKEPLSLKKNWFFAIIFISIWVIILLKILDIIIRNK